MHTWLKEANFAPSSDSKSLVFTGIDRNYFLQSIASDTNRMSLAGSETLHNIVELDSFPKSLAWPHVKLYYAAFYYAHALLRIWGISPSYFRTLELMPLRSILDAYGITAPFKMTTGQYLMSAGKDALTIEMKPDTGSKGSHESVWKTLVNQLKILQTLLEGTPYLTEDKKRIKSEISSLIAIVSNGGQNNSWLSQMRNDLQYRQAEGVWYQYKGKIRTSTLEIEAKGLIEGNVEFSSLITATGPNLIVFRSACSAVIDLSRRIIFDVGEIKGTRSFVQHGERKFESAFPVATL